MQTKQKRKKDYWIVHVYSRLFILACPISWNYHNRFFSFCMQSLYSVKVVKTLFDEMAIFYSDFCKLFFIHTNLLGHNVSTGQCSTWVISLWLSYFLLCRSSHWIFFKSLSKSFNLTAMPCKLVCILCKEDFHCVYEKNFSIELCQGSRKCAWTFRLQFP